LVEEAGFRTVTGQVSRRTMPMTGAAEPILGASGAWTSLAVARAGAAFGNVSATAKGRPRTTPLARPGAAWPGDSLATAIAATCFGARSLARPATITPRGAIARPGAAFACVANVVTPWTATAAFAPHAFAGSAPLATRLVNIASVLLGLARCRCLGDQQRGPGPQTCCVETSPPDS
jgi:hypothetical protein